MEITALGHAGFRVIGAATTGLLDPWFDPSGAFFGSWFQLPANDHLANAPLLSPDWVAVSSERGDRLDLRTLARVPAGTPLFVARAASRTWIDRLRAHTRLDVREVAPWARVELPGGGGWLTFLPPVPAAAGRGPVRGAGPAGCAVLVSIDGVTLLACGTIPPTPAQVRLAEEAVGRHVDAAAVQAADVSWEPICYEEPDAMILALSAEIRLARFRAVRAFLRVAQPTVALPFGGPPCFLDPELAQHNRWIAPPGILPDPEQVAAWLREKLPEQRVTTLLPGDRCFPTDGLTIEDPRWNTFSFAHLRSYLHDYSHARALQLSRVHSAFPEPDDSLGDRFAEHVGLAVARDETLARLAPSLVRFEVSGPGGGTWDVHIERGRARVDRDSTANGVDERFRVASRWLAAVVDGTVSWTELLGSLRFSASRTFSGRGDDLPRLLADVGDARGSG